MRLCCVLECQHGWDWEGPQHQAVTWSNHCLSLSRGCKDLAEQPGLPGKSQGWDEYLPICTHTTTQTSRTVNPVFWWGNEPINLIPSITQKVWAPISSVLRGGEQSTTHSFIRRNPEEKCCWILEDDWDSFSMPWCQACACGTIISLFFYPAANIFFLKVQSSCLMLQLRVDVKRFDLEECHSPHSGCFCPVHKFLNNIIVGGLPLLIELYLHLVYQLQQN